METSQAIRTRRSIRAYKKKKLPDEVLYTILESARWAPSAGNLQPWRIIVVESQPVKEMLADASDEQGFIAKAPVVLVVCSDTTACKKEYEGLGEKFCTQSTATAIQNILVTAHSLGVGAAWVGSFAEAKIRKELKIPDSVTIDAIIPLGYPDEKPIRKSTVEMADYVYFEKYGASGRGESIFPINEQVQKIKKGLKEFAGKLKNK